MTGIELGKQLGLWTTAPFVAMLLAIAVLPAVAGDWYSRNRNKAIVAAVLGAPTIAYLLVGFGRLGLDNVGGIAGEYLSFMILMLTLYTISGGIYLTGNLLGTPRNNFIFLLIGALLANLIGTTGAAMVLIRPLLRANSERTRTRHVVIFFIFVVCNIGGILLPLGPPLFLGVLQGVSFSWTLRLWPEWLLVVGLVLALFVAIDIYHYRREPRASLRADAADYVPMRIAGKVNLLCFAGAVLIVVLSGPLATAGQHIGFPYLREAGLLAMMGLSLILGPRGPRAANHFRWGPIVEVAVLFAGIFAVMIPALALLQAKGSDIGLTQPWHYFWASGGLSAFLDNGPTYLAFTAAAQGQVGALSAAGLMSSHVVAGVAPSTLLAAVSCGASMMGALSYIGNAPNFMVKAVAEASGLKMPSFVSYLGYATIILLPIFAVVTLVFFR